MRVSVAMWSRHLFVHLVHALAHQPQFGDRAVILDEAGVGCAAAGGRTRACAPVTSATASPSSVVNGPALEQ